MSTCTFTFSKQSASAVVRVTYDDKNKITTVDHKGDEELRLGYFDLLKDPILETMCYGLTQAPRVDALAYLTAARMFATFVGGQVKVEGDAPLMIQVGKFDREKVY